MLGASNADLALSSGHRAFARHCSTAYQRIFANRDHGVSANLRFRRWLCYEKSLAAGLAHKVFRLSNVTTWDIRKHTLFTGDLSGCVTLRTLRGGDAGVDRFRRLELLRPTLWSSAPLACRAESSLYGVFGLANGDFVVQTDTNRDFPYLPYLARITSAGGVVWKLEYDWSPIAIGAQNMYILQAGPHLLGTFNLAKIDLANGARISQSYFAAPSIFRGFWEPLKMVLIANEAFVVIECKNGILGILNTATGEWALISTPGSLTHAACDASHVLAKPESQDFVEVCQKRGRVHIIYLYTFVAPDTFYQTIYRTFPNCRATSLRGRTEYGGVMDLMAYGRVFQYTRSGLGGERDVITDWCNGCSLLFEKQFWGDGVSHFLVSPVKDDDDHGASVGKYRYPNYLTVPTISGDRKAVKFPERTHLQNREDRPDYFGIYDGYLVFHHAATDLLMVADFRPPW